MHLPCAEKLLNKLFNFKTKSRFEHLFARKRLLHAQILSRDLLYLPEYIVIIRLIKIFADGWDKSLMIVIFYFIGSVRLERDRKRTLRALIISNHLLDGYIILHTRARVSLQHRSFILLYILLLFACSSESLIFNFLLSQKLKKFYGIVFPFVSLNRNHNRYRLSINYRLSRRLDLSIIVIKMKHHVFRCF